MLFSCYFTFTSKHRQILKIPNEIFTAIEKKLFSGVEKKILGVNFVNVLQALILSDMLLFKLKMNAVLDLLMCMVLFADKDCVIKSLIFVNNLIIFNSSLVKVLCNLTNS